jgi:hypothetical protein
MIIFHNPHLYEWRSLFSFIKWVRWVKKYLYLMEYALKNNIQIWFFLDRCSFLPQKFIKFEFYVWCKLQKFDSRNIKIFYDNSFVSWKNYLLTYSSEFSRNEFYKNNINTKIIILATHYYNWIEKIAENIKKLKNYFFIAEADLNKNSLFKKYFDFYKKEIFILPFTYQKRHKRYNNNFKARKNKCIALWSYCILNHLKIMNETTKVIWEHFKLKNEISIHPLRIEIDKKKNEIKDKIDSYINNIYWWFRNYNKDDYKYIYIYKKVYNYLKVWKQKKYHSFNIVEKFNEYSMFVAPEENIWFPSINMVEWMACWCAYIWQECHIYEDYWMKAWIHYIWYDWTLNWLIQKIEYYQTHTNELEKIANNWYEFAKENFNPEKNAKKFFDYYK